MTHATFYAVIEKQNTGEKPVAVFRYKRDAAGFLATYGDSTQAYVCAWEIPAQFMEFES